MSASDTEALFEAIENGRRQTVEASLDAKPRRIEAIGTHKAGCRDKTPLMYALQCQRFGIARMLLRRGANASARMSGGPGSTVISLAVRFVIQGRDPTPVLEMIDALIDAGADPTDGLWPAIRTYHKHWDETRLIERILERGADPDQLVGNSGNTARELVRINASLYSDRLLALFTVSRGA